MTNEIQLLHCSVIYRIYDTCIYLTMVSLKCNHALPVLGKKWAINVEDIVFIVYLSNYEWTVLLMMMVSGTF